MSNPNLETHASEEENVVPLDDARVGDLASLNYSTFPYRVYNIRRDSSGKLIGALILRRDFGSVKAVILGKDVSSYIAQFDSSRYPEFDTFLQQYEHQQKLEIHTQEQGGEE
jgi:hypothetical protein